MRFYALAQRPWIEEADGSGYWGLPPGTIGSVDLAPTGSQSHVFVTSDAPFEAGGDIVATFGDGSDRLDRYILSARERSAWESLVGAQGSELWTLLDLFRSTLMEQADPDGFMRAKPIMPTSRGVLELHLGGHSRIWAERLPADPTTHPAWSRIQAVKQRNYRAIHARDPVLARKWLGNEQRRFRLPPTEARDLLIPADLPRELPLRPTTLIAESFDQADSGTLGPDLTWAEVVGSWSTVSNEASDDTAGSSFDSARAESDLSSDDHAARVTLVTISSSRWGGTAVRFSASAQTYYCVRVRPIDTHQFLKMVAGSFTVLGETSGGITLSLPDESETEADGSTISFYFNGSLIDSVTDTGITGELRTGMVGNAAGSTVRLDNFEAADLLAGGNTGTLDVTLANVTASAAGELELEGTLAATIGAITLASDGALALDATLTSALDSVTIASTGELLLEGTLTVTLGAVTLDAEGTGVVITEGALDVTLENAALSSVGSVSLQALLSQTVDAIFLDSATVLALTGEATVALGPVTLDAFGTESGVIEGVLDVGVGEIGIRAYGAIYDYDAIRNKPFNVQRRPPYAFIRAWRTGW